MLEEATLAKAEVGACGRILRCLLVLTCNLKRGRRQGQLFVDGGALISADVTSGG
jgi:hypothetical protein